MEEYCVCCGKYIPQQEQVDVEIRWQGRMEGYCVECAVNRCDTTAGMESGCPNKGLYKEVRATEL